MTAKPLRLIQCGVGGFGEPWLDEQTSKSPDFDLVALVDVAPAVLEAAGKRCNIPPSRLFGSLEQALDSVETDAVLTVTPPVVHLPHARLAFSRGLHLMTEKPLAETMENALEMTSLAARAGKQLVVSQQYRFQPCMQKLKQMLQTQALGEFGHGHLDFYIPGPFRGTFRETMDFPLLVDMAIHHVDLIRCITGQNVARVTAHSYRPSWSLFRHDPALRMVLELADGKPFSYAGDWSAVGRPTTWNGNWRLQCAQGSLHLEADRLFTAKCEDWGKNPTQDSVDAPGLERAERTQTLHSFAEAIKTGIPAETSGMDNLQSLGIIIAAKRSILERRTVSLSEVLPSPSA